MRTYTETLNEHHGLSVSYIGEPILTYKTEYQSVEVFRNPTFGRMLMLDGSVQLSQADEHIYHGAVMDALGSRHIGHFGAVVGGGDGCMLKHLYRANPAIEHIDLIELDPEIVSICKAYLALDDGALDDPRTKIHYEDGFDFLKETRSAYDFIIIDATDPQDNSSRLYSEEFYDICWRALKRPGVLVTHCGTPIIQDDLIESVGRSLREVFGNFYMETAAVPTFSFGPVTIASAYKPA